MRYIDLGLTKYREVYNLQISILKEVASSLIDDTLLLTEHKEVVTIGRRGSEKNLLMPIDFFKSRGIEILNVDRGGDVTCHMPGQVVAYPIFRLVREARDIHAFLRYLEEICIDFLRGYGISPHRIEGLRGVWIGDEKIASIGIGIKRWVTYHGIAININNELSLFSYIKPCGMADVKMTSLQNVVGRPVDIKDAKIRLAQSFEKIPWMAYTLC